LPAINTNAIRLSRREAILENLVSIDLSPNLSPAFERGFKPPFPLLGRG
jgi:hypothetical protein